MPSLDPTALPQVFGLPSESRHITSLLSSLSTASSPSPTTTPSSVPPHPFSPTLTSVSSQPAPQPTVHTYSDATYHNYPTLGLSLCYTKAGGGSSTSARLGLESIDLFIPSSSSATPSTHSAEAETSATTSRAAKTKKKEWYDSAEPPLPIELRFPSTSLPLPPRLPPAPAPTGLTRSPSSSSGSRQADAPVSADPTSLARPPSLSIDRNTTGKDLVGCLGEPSKKGSGGWTGVWLEWGRVELLYSPSTLSVASGDDSEAASGAGGVDTAETVALGMMVQLGEGQTAGQSRPSAPGGVWDKAGAWRCESIKFFKADGS